LKLEGNFPTFSWNQYILLLVESWTHNFNSIVQIHPEIGYYKNWNNPAFDLGKRRGMVLAGVDMTIRF
ncbi:MAG: hypothetical protein WCG42_09950, partial [Parachlamydiaceae bacterium]